MKKSQICRKSRENTVKNDQKGRNCRNTGKKPFKI